MSKTIPKLRFKEFREAWKSDSVGSIAKVTSGGTPNRNVKEYWDGGTIPWITTSLIDSSVITHSEEFITEEGLKNSSAKIFPVGTILMAMYGQGKTRGKVSMLGIEATTNQACAAILVNEHLSSLYLFQNLDGRYEEIRGLSNEGGQQNLSGDIIKKIKVHFPTFPEQQKIASFLSAADEKIQQLTHKKELLEQYKKGVMQQLFSGKLRFKDQKGKAYPKWEEKRLGEISNKKSSNIAANSIEENTGVYKIYGASGLLKYIDFYNESEPFISIVKDGAGVGRTLLCDANSSVLGTLDIIKPNTKVDLYFLYSVLNNIDFTKYSIGSTIPHIYFKDYSKERINIPCIEEQQKIASFLVALDSKIENVAAQIAHTQTFKKGLLQQMFV